MMDWILPWWGWFLFGFALLVLELAAPGGFYFLFYGVAALGVGILAWLGIVTQSWVQLMFFSIISILTSLLFRKPLAARFGARSDDASVDSLVAEVATVIDDMESERFGKVELRGAAWQAKNIGAQALKRGERSRVEKVDGLVLMVRKEE